MNSSRHRLKSPSQRHGIRPRSLRSKILVAVVLTSVLSIFFASLALFAHQSFRLRDQFRKQMEALSRIVADYSVAPVSFSDERGMHEALAVLASRPEVLEAEIQDMNGSLLLRYGQSAADENADLSRSPPSLYDGWELILVQPLAVGEEHLGRFVMVASFRSVFFDAVRNFIPAIALIMGGTLLVVAPVTWFLASFLLEGLQILASSAGRIAETGDYTVRARGSGQDEVGQLTGIFNAMLDRLQNADADLRATNDALSLEIAERARLEKALVEASRYAGMAEVATGVLHNVGNVLNSVNVSAQLVRERLEGSRLIALGRTARLLAPYRDDPTEFYTHDPKAKLLPKFIGELYDNLALEHHDIREEIMTLHRNIEHVKEIVSAQQSFARNAGIEELLDAADLMEDAVRIHLASIERHEIKIVPRHAPDLQLVTDRHTTLQILINLVSNAIHAVKPQPAADRLVELRTFSRADFIVFEVCDNGVGIEAKNATRIFQHGFTTRPDGHGFGLHSGANAARRMGGTLSMLSPGAGQGSTFTLELPRQHPAAETLPGGARPRTGSPFKFSKS